MKSHKSTSFEHNEVTICQNKVNLSLNILYRPPKNSTNGFTSLQFVSEFSDLIGSNLEKGQNQLIVGDLNYKINKETDIDAHNYTEVLALHSLVQHVPLVATQDSGNTLDHMLTR